MKLSTFPCVQNGPRAILKSSIGAAFLTVSVLALQQPALGAVGTWDGGSAADSNWATAANWVSDVAPAAGDSLVFAGATRLSSVNNFGNGTVFGGITFNNTAASYAISGNSIALQGNITDNSLYATTISNALVLNATPVVAVSERAGSLVLSGTISGNYGLTKTGAGTLSLTATNTFSGPLTVTGGAVNVYDIVNTQYFDADRAFGAVPSTATANSIVLDGGALRFTLSSGATLNTNRGIALGNSTNGTSGTIEVNGGVGAGLTYNGVMANNGGVNGFVKTGGGTLILGGINTYTGSTTINQSVLKLNFAALTASTANIINSASTLVMGGPATSGGSPSSPSATALTPTLIVAGKTTASTNVQQTFNGLTLNQGSSTISTTQGVASSGVLLNLGAITHNAGGVVNFSAGGTVSASNGITTTTTNDASGILGGWAIYSGTDYATVDANGLIGAYSGYTTVAASGAIADGATTNVKLTGGGTITLSGSTNGATNINTLTQATTVASTVNIGSSGVLRLGVNGGILLANTGAVTISSGTLTAGGNTRGTAGEITIYGASAANSSGITINSVIANNNASTGSANSTGGGAVTLTINATHGTTASIVTLGGANTYSGGTYINDGGRVGVSNASAFGTGAVYVLTGAQAWLSTNIAVANDFYLSGLGNTENGGLGAIRNVGGTISGKVTLTGDARIGASGGTGIFSGQITGGYNLDISGGTTVLKNQTASANNWSGNTTIGGNTNLATTVKLGASEQITNGVNAGNVTITTGTLDLGSYNETINGLNGTGSVNNSVGGNSVLTVGDNDQSGSYGGVIKNTAGTLSLVKIGAGTQILTGVNTYTGTTTVSAGELSVNGSLAAGSTVSVGSGATLSGAGVVSGAVGINGGTINGNGLSLGDTTFDGVSALKGTATANSIVVSTGNTTVSGTVTVTNGLTVNGASVLKVNGRIAGDANVNVNGILGGNGSVSGVTSINGTLAPGNSIGTITTGSLTLGATSVLDVELGRDGATASSDKTNVIGTVNIISGADLKLTLYTGLTSPQVDDIFFLIDNDGLDGITGEFTKLNGVDTTLSEGSSFTWNSQQWKITYQADAGATSFTGGNDVAIMAVVPEPSTWTMLLGGMGLLGFAQRMRRRSNA